MGDSMVSTQPQWVAVGRYGRRPTGYLALRLRFSADGGLGPVAVRTVNARIERCYPRGVLIRSSAMLRQSYL
ncbi:hypothetical protein B4U45_10765 [Mycobacterium persicum]|uniref:Uncharacterized protein n=1 Tax=Mycobacterium persicum TaxID=1487726 RepID=A0A8E2IS39_9MYCO|nr:hypothetical protein A4G31_10015 [Mycobacterium persicum]ORC07019.1 hypothetical protein B4U45_10765 [Mycobacterium persicum]